MFYTKVTSFFAGFLTQCTIEEGENLISQLLLPVKDSNGKDVQTNNQLHIEEAQNNIATLLARKQHFDDLANVRKLKLKEVIELNKCENEAEKVIC